MTFEAYYIATSRHTFLSKYRPINFLSSQDIKGINNPLYMAQ